MLVIVVEQIFRPVMLDLVIDCMKNRQYLGLLTFKAFFHLISFQLINHKSPVVDFAG